MDARRQMQMVVTRFERISRRISLSGLMSGHKAETAIAEGRVQVDGKRISDNFKVFSEARVTVDGIDVPPPGPLPKLWGMRKPRNVLCQLGNEEGQRSLRSMMRQWREWENKLNGDAQSIGLAAQSLEDKNFVVINGLPYAGDGLVLMTNDGIFADALSDVENRILSVYDLKIAADPPVELMHKWRTIGARAEGRNFGRVFTSITKRSVSATWLRLRFVEGPDRPVELLLDRARLRVHRLRRYAFGPYVATNLPERRVVPLPIVDSLRPLVPKADMRQTLIRCPGGVLDQDGRLRDVRLEDSAVLSSASCLDESGQEQEQDHQKY